MNNEARIIKFIRKRIPPVKCKENCSDCCHDLILFSDWEWDQIKDKRIATSCCCPYLNTENRCDIYEQRPIICRLYGVNDGILKCKNGIIPYKPLQSKKEAKLYILYGSLFKNDLLSILRKSADLNKIAEIIKNTEDKSQYTNFMQTLGERLSLSKLQKLTK